MSRCIACNRILPLGTVTSSKESGDEEDMCGICRAKAQKEFSVTSDLTYIRPPLDNDISENVSGYYYDYCDWK